MLVSTSMTHSALLTWLACLALTLPAADEMQMLSDDKQLHLLRKVGDRYRPVVSTADWPGYNGDPRGNRFSKLAGINASNVARLAPHWIFPISDGSNLQVTPVVVQG